MHFYLDLWVFSHKTVAAEANHATVPVRTLYWPHSAGDPGEKTPESQTFFCLMHHFSSLHRNEQGSTFNVVSRF